MRNWSPPPTTAPPRNNGHAGHFQSESSSADDQVSAGDEVPNVDTVTSRFKQWVDQYPGVILGTAVLGGVLLGYWMKRK